MEKVTSNKKEKTSFTKSVKEEVSLYEGRSSEEFKGLLAGFIKINGHLVVRNGEWIISIRSENIKTAKLVLKELKYLYSVDARISISEKKRLRVNADNRIVTLDISSKAKEILKSLEIYSEEKGFDCLPSIAFLNKEEVRRAFFAGAFLASGSVNSPTTKNYHLEIAVNDKDYADFLIKQLKKFYLEAKAIQRRNQTVVYLKKSEQIGDFLKIIGAYQSLLKYEDVRIMRDQYNSMNRLYNCEISNEKKAMEIGNKQAEEIAWYRDNVGLQHLDKPLRIIAEVRLANPEGTYNELANACYETFNLHLSKPGLSYRMTKLLDVISKVKGEM